MLTTHPHKRPGLRPVHPEYTLPTPSPGLHSSAGLTQPLRGWVLSFRERWPRLPSRPRRGPDHHQPGLGKHHAPTTVLGSRATKQLLAPAGPRPDGLGQLRWASLHVCVQSARNHSRTIQPGLCSWVRA